MSSAARALDPGNEGAICPGLLRRESPGSQGPPRALLLVSACLLGWLNLGVSMTRDALQACVHEPQARPGALGHDLSGPGYSSKEAELRSLPRLTLHTQGPCRARATEGLALLSCLTRTPKTLHEGLLSCGQCSLLPLPQGQPPSPCSCLRLIWKQPVLGPHKRLPLCSEPCAPAVT